jgi:thiol peroxidase
MTFPEYITFHGDPYALSGEPVAAGTPAPDFTLVRFQDGVQGCLERSDLLASGKPTLISVITSVDTPVGSLQSKTFDALLSEHATRINALLVSSDLPFTLNRFRVTEGLKVLVGVSDYYGEFGERFGVLIADPRILARAIFVLDASCVVRHAEVVNEITTEPDYQAAIAALVSLL